MKIEPFNEDGEDSEEWLRLFEKAAHANNWNDERKLLLAPTYLRRTADGWFRALVAAPISYARFRTIFREQFRSQSQISDISQKLG